MEYQENSTQQNISNLDVCTCQASQPDCSSNQQPHQLHTQPSHDQSTENQQISEQSTSNLPTIPPLSIQADIIRTLQGSTEDSICVYAVAKSWYDTWVRYVGQRPAEDVNDESHNPGHIDVGCQGNRSDATTRDVIGGNQCHGYADENAELSLRDQVDGSEQSMKNANDDPGPVIMDTETEDNNLMVDERIWKYWVNWYGLDPSHDLDRRNWASEEKEFEICVLSPFCTMLQNPTKDLDLSEETGYIELQLKRIFRVPHHRKTRMWLRQRGDGSPIYGHRFQLILNRNEELCFQESLDHSRDYILAIEVADTNGDWPTAVSGEPYGTLDKFKDLLGRPLTPPSWEKNLQTQLCTILNGVKLKSNETAENIVTLTRKMNEENVSTNKAKEFELQAKLSQVNKAKQEFDVKIKQLEKYENKIKTEGEQLKTDRESFDASRAEFQEEVVKMESMNKIQKSRIKLNVGGHSYMTSTMTLVKDSNSMLAAMFSGRHNISYEEDGSVFIDRDGTHFRYILNYLRDGGFKNGVLPKDPVMLTELQTEAEYYQLAELGDYLAEYIEQIQQEETDKLNASTDVANGLKQLRRKIAQRMTASEYVDSRCEFCGEIDHDRDTCEFSSPIQCWLCSEFGHKQKHCVL